MNAALFLPILFPILCAPFIYVLRRYRLATQFASIISLISAFLAWRQPIGVSMSLLGRPIAYDYLSRWGLMLLFISSAVLFWMAHRTAQGWTFYPLALVTMGVLGSAMFIRHLGIAALVVEVAAVISVLAIQGGQPGSTQASLRFLTMLTLGVPFFLIAAWRYDLYQQGVENAASLGLVALFSGIGFAIWLAAVPLHGWFTSVASDAPPLVAAFILLAFPITAFILLMQQMSDAVWLGDMWQVPWLLFLTGMLMQAYGSVMASVQRAFGSLMGYSALSFLGLAVSALSFGGRSGPSVSIYILTIYALALLLTAIPTAILRYRNTSDAFVLALGQGWKLPWIPLAYLSAGLIYCGAPLFAGFPARWLYNHALAASLSPWVPVTIFLCLGSLIGFLRGLRYLMNPLPGGAKIAPLVQSSAVLLIALICLALVLGIMPQPLLNWYTPLFNSVTIPHFIMGGR